MGVLYRIRWYWWAWRNPPPTLIDKHGVKRYVRPLWVSKRREISLDIRVKPKEEEE
jgi:hypothetical protein